jgi:hypothetical protein
LASRYEGIRCARCRLVRRLHGVGWTLRPRQKRAQGSGPSMGCMH